MRLLCAAAVIAVAAFAASLPVRQLSSSDLGYHLAYGLEFWHTGHVVDANPYIYTLPQYTQQPPYPPPGPGCWYDSSGQYRFPNANWLSQVIMAGVYSVAGPLGLSALAALLAWGVFLLGVLIMKRLGTPWLWAAGGLLLLAMASYERLELRPELFGYLVLAGELYVLVRGPLTGRSVVWLVGLQLLLVNLHSYFPLGMMMTGCVLATRGSATLWRRLRGHAVGDEYRQDVRQFRLAAVALAGKVVVAFINPWTWRLAIMPVQTLLFMRANGIAGATPGTVSHPWSYIGEFFAPLDPAFAGLKATGAMWVVLAVVAAAALACLLQRRWSILLLLVSLIGVGLSMRRNMAPASMLTVPLAVASLHSLLAAAAPRLGVVALAARGRVATGAAAATLLAAGLWLTVSVATQTFYFAERMPWRFGVGLSRMSLPLGAAGWLTEHQPQGRLWVDFSASSNLYFFTQPHPQVSTLTNTWAYPPATMAQELDVLTGREPLAQATAEYSLNVAAFAVDTMTSRQQYPGLTPLLQQISASPDWALVKLDGVYVVYVRRGGPNDQLVRRLEITEQNIDIAAYRQQVEAMDPLPQASLHAAGMTLYDMGWMSAASELFRAAVRHDDSYYQAWNMLGTSLARRAVAADDPQAAARDFRDARDALQRALYIRPDYQPAQQNLRKLQADEQRLSPSK